jgi:hypothetical protein
MGEALGWAGDRTFWTLYTSPYDKDSHDVLMPVYVVFLTMPE